MNGKAIPATTTMLAMVGLSLMPVAAAAEGLQPIEYTFGDGTVIRFSGQINMGVLNFNDGQQSRTYFVDNDNSSSRARVQLFATPGDWKLEFTFEVEYQPLASNEVSQLDSRPDWEFGQNDIRKAEAAFSNERFGKIWFGQGSTATDGVAEVDKSGTTVIAYSSIADTAGGQFFRFEGDGLSDITIGDAIKNYDGLGRKFRLRYDTPTFHGFGLRTSYGVDWLVDDPKPLYDVSLTYDGGFDDFALGGAIGYARNDDSDTNIFSGSISGLHKPSGLSLTFAAGQQDGDGPTGKYGYVKLGYEHDFFEMGSTAFSVDYYFGNDIAADDFDSSSVGLAAVQNIDASNLSLWALWRDHHYNDPNGEYDDGQAIFGGAIFKF